MAKFPFKPKVKKIKKIIGAPAKSIKKWCYETKKTITPNALKPSKKKQVKKKKLEVPQLQRLLIQIVDKVNELIDQITQVPDLEEKVYKLENQLKELAIQFDLDIKEVTDIHVTDIESLSDTHVEDIEKMTNRQKSGFSKGKLRHDRHTHQFGPTGWSPYTGPIRTYTKNPRKSFFKGGGKAKPVITTRNKKDNLKRKLIKDIERLQK